MQSPWITEKPRTRTAKRLASALDTDVVIIGGGIAGITSAYFILKNTDLRVTLLEAGEVGGSATGHNAGILIGDIERPLRSVLNEYGPEMTQGLLSDLRGSWALLERCIADLELAVPLYQLQALLCLKSDVVLHEYLEDALLRTELNDPVEPVYVREDLLPTIEKKYHGVVRGISVNKMQSAIEVADPDFRGYWPDRHTAAGNSRILAEEIAVALLARYEGRFALHEQTQVKRLIAEKALVSAITDDGHTVSARHVVLATNGFETLHIDNRAGAPIETSFHYQVRGAIGFMLGFLVEGSYPPAVKHYLGIWDYAGDPVYGDEVLEDPYLYLSRRPYGDKTLIAVGGPQDFVDDTTVYSRDYVFPKKALSAIKDFLKNYRIPLPEKPDFMWHGLMGYTRSGLRLVGTEPKNPRILYNLGCNGIGLLPSFVGSERIARILKGEKLSPSVFDPKG